MIDKIRLLIVDDHKMFLEGLVSMLQDEELIEIVTTAINGEDALKKLNEHSVDLVISDISMPVVDGIQLSKAIRKKFPKISILILSMLNEPEVISNLINSGVHGYLLKNAEKEELLRAIHVISHGDNYFSHDIKDIYIQNQFSRPKRSNIIETLSKRECDVLYLIAEEHTTKEIADKLNLSQHTIETHRRNMLSKLGVRNTAGLVKYAIQNNILSDV